MACTTCQDLGREFDLIKKEIRATRDNTELIKRMLANQDARIKEIETNTKVNIDIGKATKGLGEKILIGLQAASLILQTVSLVLQGMGRGDMKRLLKATNDSLYASTQASIKADKLLTNNLEIITRQQMAAKDTAFTHQGIKEIKSGLLFINSNLIDLGRRLNNLATDIPKLFSVQLPKIVPQLVKQISSELRQSTKDTAKEVSKGLEKVTEPLTKGIEDIRKGIKNAPKDISKTPSPEVKKIENQVTKFYDISRTQAKQSEEQAKEIKEVKKSIVKVSQDITKGNSQPDKITKGLADIAALVTPFPALIGAVGKKVDELPKTPQFGQAVSEGVCRTAQPGGCMGRAISNSASDVKSSLGSKLDGLNVGLNAAELALLKRIDGNVVESLNRIGKPLNGGLGGKLVRIAEAAHLPQALNLLTFITVLHNATLVSADLVQTLGNALSQGLGLIGIKDSEGGLLNINQLIGQSVEGFIISIIGAEQWSGIKKNYALASAVWRAAANVVDTVRSIGNSVQAIAEVAAENSGKIGNALIRDRVISEDAFPYMSEQVSPNYLWMERLQNLEDAASAINSVIGEVANIEQSWSELQTQRQELDNALTSANPKIREANAPVSTARTEQKENSTSSVDDETSTDVGETI